MLNREKELYREKIEKAIKRLYKIDSDFRVPILTPPSQEMGDAAYPMFQFSKLLKKSPMEIAKSVKDELEREYPGIDVRADGPYVNVKIDLGRVAGELRKRVLDEGESYGDSDRLKNKRVMIEFSCPNTNKPLHLGHMRNDSIGEAVSKILSSSGAEVKKVNLINNRGVHICKSMLAYKTFGNGETPESTGEKGDHFVGRYYVKFNTWQKEVDRIKEANPEASKDPDFLDPEIEAQKMLKKWEEGDEDVRSLWTLMNKWTLDGLMESYRNMNISFDKFYYESETYKLGKDEVLKGLEMGVFEKMEDGSVQIDLSPIKLDRKVLLRKDGTSLYITQDLGTAIKRHEDYPFDSLIYVVASEQQYHFKVLFYVLEKLGYSWAKELRHLSYGMVNLPSGKMKSREGTVVDADDLLESLTDLALKEIRDKGRESEISSPEEVAHDIALGALNYYLLQVQSPKDMIFDPNESISFSGNTGPYLEYMGARISSIIRKFNEEEYIDVEFDGSLLFLDDEKALIKAVSAFPDVIERASESLDPSSIASYLYETAKTFSRYYHDNPILGLENKALTYARIELLRMIRIVLKKGFWLLGIPFLEKM